jgi:predicted ATPase
MLQLEADQDYRVRLSGPDAPQLHSPSQASAHAPAPYFSTTSEYPFSLSAPSDSGTSLMESPFFAQLFDPKRLPTGFPYLDGPDSKTQLHSAYDDLVANSHSIPGVEPVAGLALTDGAVVPVIMGRKLRVPRCENGVAFFHFEDLCKGPLGAADYISLCHHFHTIVIQDIPQMNMDTRDQARRFITLVDELYNHKIKLVCSATVQPKELFNGAGSLPAWQEAAENLEFEYEGPRDMAIDIGALAGSNTAEVERANALSSHMVRGDPGSKSNTLVSGEDDMFAFDRAVSRLMEMSSRYYLLKPKIQQNQ